MNSKRTAPHLYVFVACGVLVMGSIGTGTNACTPAQREGAKSVVEAFDFACVVAHQILADSQVAEVCHVTDPYRDTMRQLLGSARAETNKAVSAARAETMAAAAAKCPSCAACAADGGAR